MTKDQIAELEATLLKFVNETVKNAASEEAVKVLSEVAKVLVDLETLNRS